MLRTEREYTANPQLNQLEYDWWNANADTIARVWQMPDVLSSVVRSSYLGDAKNFFLRGRKTSRVLELGCGSGWVGQAIASPTLTIIGTDFSERQIQLASNNAHNKGLGAYCSYTVADEKAWPEEFCTADSVLIHAFLHHLDQQELSGLVSSLSTRLPKGTRIWIYEPTFLLNATDHRKAALPVLAVRLLSIASTLNRIIDGLLKRFALIDEATLNTFTSLQEEACRRDWYLSPKEVPLERDRFSKELASRFNLLEERWVTLYVIGWVFCISLVKNGALRWVLSQTAGRFYALVDRILANQNAYVDKAMIAPAHAFHVWKCEAR